MKINKIRIKNINSLRGDWELDFTKEPFVSAMLFSITGPTGSGKSTLLDVVTLSLFNQIPRIDKALSKTIVEEGGFILSRNETECIAEVEYTCKSGTYRSKWSISVNRNGNLRDYEMEITDLSTNEILDKKKREVPETNAALIGLNYEQFIRSILLSQGGFSRFLDAKKEERAKLLEQITGTDIYRKLGIKAFETWRDKNKEIETNETRIEDLKKELLTDEEQQNRNADLKALFHKIKNLQDEKDKLTKLGLKKESIARLQIQLKENETKLTGLLKEESAFSVLNKTKLNKHRELAPYLVQIEQYNELLKNKKELEAIVPTLEQEKNNNETRLEELKNRIQDFNGTKFVDDDAEKMIQHFRAEIIEKEKTKTQTQSDFEYQHKKLNDCLNRKLLDVLKREEDYASLYEEINKKILDINKELITLRESGLLQDSIKQIKEEASARKDALIQLKGNIVHYTKLVKEIKQIKEELNNYLTLIIKDENIIELDKVVEQARKKFDDQNEKLIHIREENSANVIALRKSLRENEPCMVCGSVHHPYIHEYVSVLNEELDLLSKLKCKFDEAKANLDNAKTSNELNKELITKRKQGLEEKEEDLKKVQEEVDLLKKLAGIEEIKSSDNLEVLIKKEEQTLEDIGLFEANTQLLNALKEALAELILATGKKVVFEKAEQELLSRYKGDNILKDTENFLTELNTIKNLSSDTINKINLNKNQLDKNNNSINNTEKEILAYVQALGYSSIIESYHNILNHTEFTLLEEEDKRITSGIHHYQQLIGQSEKLLQAEQINDDDSITEEQCKERLSQLLPELEEKETEKANISYQINADLEKRKKMNVLEEEIATTREVNKKWNYLNKLIGDSTGNRFNSFAQKFTLAKLVKLANVHLRKLNERYVLDMPGIGEEEDLIIVDGWMGEERRSVKTLSGGEKFLISLSLALALSDLASRHVKIESLFIDEGFGTLDPETLDQAISTLEQLQSSSGKSVGIISHVEELKERIQTQIRLEKSAAGFSTISILPEG
jgi:exonuclease SbcC